MPQSEFFSSEVIALSLQTDMPDHTVLTQLEEQSD